MRDNDYYHELVERYPQLGTCLLDIKKVFDMLVDMYRNGGKLLIAGNGGSAADAEHIVGELMKSFKSKRKIDDNFNSLLTRIDKEKGEFIYAHLQDALPAIALDGHYALNTAFINDVEPLLCFAQQVYGYGKCGDTLLCISTSGNSRNVVYAAITAKAKGMKVVSLTGKNESDLSRISDCCIRVPETETYKVQELHLPVYHTLCLMLENEFFE